MTTFKEHIAPHVADFYDFVLLRNQAIAERQTVLVSIKFSHIPVSQVFKSTNQNFRSQNPEHPYFNLTKEVTFSRWYTWH